MLKRIVSVLTARWRDLAESLRQHLWFAMMVLLALLWSMNVGVKPGLAVHFLGLTVFTLMFGWQLAVIGSTIALVALAIQAGGGFDAIAANALIDVALPALVSHAVWRLTEHRLPRHLFVYLFVSGFANGAIAIGLVGVATAFLYAAVGSYPFGYLVSDYLSYYILLAYGEATLTGMAITMMTVYSPWMLASFDAPRYLRSA